MKDAWYVITGATGHIGRRIAEPLLAAGRRVRVIGRSADRLKSLSELGAEPVVGSIEEPAVLRRALQKAAAVFLMVPPNPAVADFRAWQKGIVEIYAAAVRESGVARAVTLSSIGAGLSSGTGPILGLHYLEEALTAIKGLSAVHLRPAFFMENHLHSIPAIRATGGMITPLRPDLPMPMIATQDIAGVAAQVLQENGVPGASTREVLGPRDVTMQDVARILGRAIGQPDLPYAQAPYEAAEKAMMGAGMSASVAGLMTEMERGFNEGRIKALEQRSPSNFTPTTIEEFARTVFAPAYVGGA